MYLKEYEYLVSAYLLREFYELEGTHPREGNSDEELKRRRFLELVNEEVPKQVCPQIAKGKRLGTKMMQRRQVEGVLQAVERAKEEGIDVDRLDVSLGEVLKEAKAFRCSLPGEVPSAKETPAKEEGR